ncbi:MAG: Unknown protein [uncultured Thiotrichaceae bacterium]|uniref:YMGG-like Gly-zipper domain-containing protein n=1 Tax=uncultured Thiotrichaceae bacterium TaxID=298394 RepID=A0A6S6RWA8_9GAMM|nr:MAG: Unknown protein [uncultured Thiotrichaceae bacterium]
MKRYLLLTLMIGSGVIFNSGCSSNTANGAAIGSLVGAGIGKSTANHKDKRAAIGAVVGGAVGAAIGAESDRAANNTTNTTNSTSYNDASIRHTHDYGNGSSQTHAHSGGDVRHSHQQQYSDPYVYRSDVRGYNHRNHKKRHPRKHRHNPYYY